MKITRRTIAPNPGLSGNRQQRKPKEKIKHNLLHFANWEGGSGHCYCMCSACFVRLPPGPKGESRGGICICKDCPCGGVEFTLSRWMP
jgi:hypothetical protein